LELLLSKRKKKAHSNKNSQGVVQLYKTNNLFYEENNLNSSGILQKDEESGFLLSKYQHFRTYSLAKSLSVQNKKGS